MSEIPTPVTPDNGKIETPQPVEVGELTVGEQRLLESLRGGADQIVREIGNLEVRKHQLFGRLQQLEGQAQSVLNNAAKRLNIPQGETWHVTPDGKVRRGAAVPGS
jgi:hypothetical protein